MNIPTLIPIIISALLTLFSVVMAFRAWRWTPLTAYMAMWPLYYLTEFTGFTDSLLTFWGIATLIALGINYMLPFSVATSRTGMAYMAGGALAGTFVGLLATPVAGVICGSAAGGFLGALAFSRMRAGKVLAFPSRRFFNYIVAKGLPLVVEMSASGLVGIAIYQYFLIN